jgi:alanyl aminopeptidase
MSFIRHVAAMVALLAALGVLHANAADEPAPSLHLPDGVRPERYAVTLSVVPGEAKVQARIAIDIKVDAPQSLIWLHADRIAIGTVDVDGSVSRATLRTEHPQVVGMAFDPPLEAGAHRVTLDYEANQDLKSTRGIFAVRDAAGWYAMTQFEALSARRAFPCFDEPRFKVPWQLTLRVPRDLTAVSNAPIAEERVIANGMKEIAFAPTKPLPSYLVAFAVGPFDVLDAGRVGETPIRIVAPRGRIADLAFARRALPELLAKEAAWFAVPFPYAKLDHAAIPLTVRFAMENAGLITYGAPILIAPGATPAPFRHGLANVGAHEMAHQWFGNLVTMRDWDDLWLNEAFANWLAQKMVDAWDPSYEHGSAHVHERADAIEADALAGARRIRQPIATRGDVFNAFDSITYEKGATVIGMFEAWLGNEPFRQGIRTYLERHANGNATTGDFLDALQANTGKRVVPAFASFLDQNGVPQVSVELDCKTTPPRLLLSQRRHAAPDAPASAQRWQIPVCARYGNAKATNEACTLLSAPSSTLALGAACPTFVMANAGGRGYYVPEYRGKLLAQLLAKPGAMTPAEAASVVYDLRPLLRAGAIDATQVLDGIRVGARSRERSVVTAALAVANNVRDTLVSAREMDAFAAFVRQTFAPRARALGFVPRRGESDDDRLLRRALLSFAAPFDPPLAMKARRLARAWLHDRHAVDPDIVDAVLLTAARTGDASLFDAMAQEALATDSALDRRNLLIALMSFGDPALAKRGLSLLLDPRIDVREATTAWSFAMDRAPRRVSHEFVVAHFDALAARVDPDTPGGWPGVASRLCRDDDRRDVERFWRPRLARYAGAERNLAEALESIDGCVRLRAREQRTLGRYLGLRE